MRFGWPSKEMPNISNASRSCQLAPAKVELQVPMLRSSSGTSALKVTPMPAEML